MAAACGLFILAGCASYGAGIRPDAKTFSLQHGTVNFAKAMDAAEAHCQGMGLHATHLGTDRGGFYLVSRFRCE